MKGLFDGFKKKFPRYISYTVPPMMILLINWSSVVETKTLTQFFCLVLVAFILMMITVNSNTKTKRKRYLDFGEALKILTYLGLIITVGLLVSYTSQTFNEYLSNLDNELQISYIIIAGAVFLFVVDYSMGNVKWKLSYTIVTVLILFNLLLQYVFTNIDITHHTKYIFWQQKTLFLFLTLYSVILFYKITKYFVKPYNTIEEDTEFPPKKHLIVFLSSVLDTQIVSWEKVDFTRGSLLDVIEKLKKEDARHAWEMALISIEHHLENKNNPGRLEQLTIFASSTEDNGKEASIILAKHFIKKLHDYTIKNKIKLRINLANKDGSKVKLINDRVGLSYNSDHYTSKFGIDFGSYDEINRSLAYILTTRSINLFKHEDTVIDVTGGQKSTSISATLVATVLDVNNQYVDTGTKEIKGYNFLYQDPTSSGG